MPLTLDTRGVETYAASRQVVNGTEILSKAQTGEKRGSNEEELHCECA